MPENTTPSQMMRLAERLRDARSFLNLSQQFVSDETGIPRSAISEIERGVRKVDSLELQRLSNVYRLSSDFLLPGQASGGDSSETITALARATKQMTADEQDQVLRFALFLKNYKTPSGDQT